MRVGYFCATPLHILNAVTMRLTTDKQGEARLYVYDHFADASRMVQALEGLGLFDRVVLYENNTLSFGGKCRRALWGVLPHPVIRPLLTGVFPFDKVVFFALDALTMTQLMRHGRECAFYYGEDGIGSYINPQLYQASRISRCLLRLTGRYGYLSRIRGLYLHAPALRVVKDSLPVYPMERVSFSHGAMASVLEALWPVEESTIDTSRRVVYFREPLHELFGTDLSALEEQALRMAGEAFGAQGVYIKNHPRMATGAEDDRTLPCGAPYERLMGLWNQEEAVLLSVISTAALQPLLLAGQRPFMIFLYRMALSEDAPLRRLWDGFFNNLRQQYPLAGRLFTPATTHELKEAITRASCLRGGAIGRETGN